MPYVQRGNEFAEEIQIVTDGNTYFPAARRTITNNVAQRNNLYPVVGHYPNPVFAGYPRGNVYPTSVTSGTHAVRITYDPDTSHGGYSGEEFSDATGTAASLRFDGGDGSVVVDMDEKSPPLKTRTRSHSTDSEKEAESDVSSSETSHLQEITLREERC